MIDRAELDQWLRERDYALVTREQAARFAGALGLPGVVPWDVHRAALAKADAKLVAARAEIERLRGELAAAESTIAALEDPELRAALSEPTTGDFGPVPHPDPIDHGDGPRTETVP